MTNGTPLFHDMSEREQRAAKGFVKLMRVMAALRNPDGGCPWDLVQDFNSIAPYSIEEAYEVADAIARGDMNELRSELGDLLFQVVFHSQMASEANVFDVADVVTAIADKMVRRHPHVFDAPDGRDADGQTIAWEDMKAQERAAGSDTSAIQGVALALPALIRAEKLQKRAARVGFDWAEPEPIFDKLAEETDELRDAMTTGDAKHVEEELGDLLFVAANLSRRLGVDPEVALRAANTKFERRFRAMEALAAEQGTSFSALNLEDQEALWQSVKSSERST